jgi:hypothetical protein
MGEFRHQAGQLLKRKPRIPCPPRRCHFINGAAYQSRIRRARGCHQKPRESGWARRLLAVE